jgi:RNA polymerase II subunit A small phosphatase-like protein
MNNRTLLVLDVDESLVHTTVGFPLNGREADFNFECYYVHKRPYLDQFLDRTGKLYEHALWSYGTDDYVQFLASHLFPREGALAFAWSRNRCTHRRDPWTGESVNIKDLKKVKKLGFTLERTLLVEDVPANGRRQYGNVIAVQPFEGQEDDDELLRLATYLEKLYHQPNFRKVEKRGWRSSV